MYEIAKHQGTYRLQNGTDSRYVIGVNLGYRHRQLTRSRVVAMFALRSDIPTGLEIHHNDQNRLNDKPSNLVIGTPDQHRMMDAISYLRNKGFRMGLKPNGSYHKDLEGVIWVGDFLKDYAGVIEDAIAWVKEVERAWELERWAIWHTQNVVDIRRRF